MCLQDMILFQKEMEVYNRPLFKRAEILQLSPRLFFLTLAETSILNMTVFTHIFSVSEPSSCCNFWLLCCLYIW